MCQIDRCGNNNVVYYDFKKERAEKDDFKLYIQGLTKFEEVVSDRSTDIVDLTKMIGVSSFNISCGYYKEHHLDEYIDLNDMLKTYYSLDRLLSDANNSSFFRINITN